jgi:hypothetical protein
MKKQVILGIVALLVSTSVWANNTFVYGDDIFVTNDHSTVISHKDKKKNGELRKEIKAYIDKNVMPILKEQRAKLDSKISPQDQQKLAELRKKLETLKEQRKNFKKEFGKAMQNDELNAEQLLKRQELRKEMKAIRQNSKEMAKIYEKEILEVTAPLEKQREQWKQDIQAIVQKYVQKRQEEKKEIEKTQPQEQKATDTMEQSVQSEADKDKKGRRNWKDDKGRMGFGFNKQLKEMKPAAFLLMQPTK